MRIGVHGARHGSWWVARLSGDLDVASSEPFRDALDREMSAQGLRDLCLNLSDVSFVDSSGVGMILGRYRRLRAMGGRMAIAGARPAVRAVLELAGVHRVVPLFESEPEALAAGRAG